MPDDEIHTPGCVFLDGVGPCRCFAWKDNVTTDDNTDSALPKFLSRGSSAYWVTFNGRKTVGTVRKDDFQQFWSARRGDGTHVGSTFPTRAAAAEALRPRSEA